MVFLELRRDSRVTTGNSGCLLCWPQEPQVTVVNIKLRSPAFNDLQKCTQLWASIIPNLESLTVYDTSRDTDLKIRGPGCSFRTEISVLQCLSSLFYRTGHRFQGFDCSCRTMVCEIMKYSSRMANYLEVLFPEVKL